MARVTYNMYQSFLNGIRRTKTSSVSPDKWNDLVNKVISQLIDPVEDSLSLGQRLDDLAGFYRITLDDKPYKPIQYVDQGTDFMVFPIPTFEHNELTTYLGSDEEYPTSKRIMKAWGRIVVTPGRDPVYGEWIDLLPVKSDFETAYRKNYYLKGSKETRLLYSIEKGENYPKVLKVLGATDIEHLRLRYITFNREVWLDEYNFNDNENNVEHTPGGGSVPPDFPSNFIDRVVNITIETYLRQLGIFKQEK